MFSPSSCVEILTPNVLVFKVGGLWEMIRASLEAQMVKTLPPMQEIRVCSLGQEDPLEKGLATHSSILAWRTPMDRGAS